MGKIRNCSWAPKIIYLKRCIEGIAFISFFVLFSEEERHVKANDRDYNEKFSYTVSELH